MAHNRSRGKKVQTASRRYMTTFGVGSILLGLGAVALLILSVMHRIKADLFGDVCLGVVALGALFVGPVVLYARKNASR